MEEFPRALILVNVFIMIEEAYKIQITDAEAAELYTLNDLAKMIEQKLDEKDSYLSQSH
jgi:acyl carrier protein